MTRDRSLSVVTRRATAVALSTVLFAGVAASPAAADRPPTKRERAAILRGVHAYSSKIRACEIGSIRVSTVNRYWSVFAFGYAHGETAISCPNVPTGRIVLRRTHGRWQKSAVGSYFGDQCGLEGMPPHKVAQDLLGGC